MELRQLRYFVTLAEELHFGRAAAREHIVQSALSQQLQRLERELGTRLLERSTHHVQLTPAGTAFLVEVREILAHIGRAAASVGRAPAPALRVGVVDQSYDSMSRVLGRVRQAYPDLEIHEIEAGVPEQVRMLGDGRLDLGIGRASPVTAGVNAELFRLDPVGVLLPARHRLATATELPVAALAHERLLFADAERAPEFNQFVADLCTAAGFLPTIHRGTVHSIRSATDLVAQGRCVVFLPESVVPASGIAASGVPASNVALAGVPHAGAGEGDVVWRPLVDPVPHYPWSLLWRAGDASEHVGAALAAARRLSSDAGWLGSPVRAA